MALVGHDPISPLCAARKLQIRDQPSSSTSTARTLSTARSASPTRCVSHRMDRGCCRNRRRRAGFATEARANRALPDRARRRALDACSGGAVVRSLRAVTFAYWAQHPGALPIANAGAGTAFGGHREIPEGFPGRRGRRRRHSSARPPAVALPDGRRRLRPIPCRRAAADAQKRVALA